MNIRTPSRLNGTLRSEYEGRDLSLSEFKPLEADWRVIFEKVMRRSNEEQIKLFGLWRNHILSVLIEIDQAGDNTHKVEDWIRRAKNYYASSIELTPASAAAASIAEELIGAGQDKIAIDGAVEDIRSRFDYYINEIERSGDMDASLAMLLVFSRNYCALATRFNRRMEELAQMYRSEMLRVEPKGIEQDKAHVVINPICGEDLFILPRGEKLKTEDGLLYSLNCDSYVSPAKIIKAHSIFMEGGEAFRAPLGGGARLFDAQNEANQVLEYNWVIAADILRLQEGEREISLKFATAQVGEFRIYTSHAEGWAERSFTLKSPQIVTLNVASSEPPLAPCSKEIHTLSTQYPAIRLVTKSGEQTFCDIEIEVNVSDITSFKLASEIGELDSSQPFYPFGPLGERGAWFSFGSEEFAGKNLSRVALKGVWSALPEDGFVDIYKDYETEPAIDASSFLASSALRRGKRWRETADDLIPLFATTSCEAEFALELCSTETSEGYYRIKLSEPSIGFGSTRYRQLFASIMLYNSSHSKRREREVPKEPIIPLLSDATLCYSASAQSVQQVFRQSELLEYESIELDKTREYPFMPHLDASIIIGLEGIADQKRLDLFFDVKFLQKGNLSDCNIDIEPPHWEYYEPKQRAWIELEPERLLLDETYELTKSGVVGLDISDLSRNDTIYLRALWRALRPLNIRMNDIFLNCFAVTAIEGDGTSLGKKSINALVRENKRVESVWQPFDGYGGKQREEPEQMARRTTNRIATRNRALTPLDYETLILERFAEIDKVCCIPANRRHSKVRIVLFPRPQVKTLVELPKWKLRRVEEYLKAYISPFAQVEAIRPQYEFISIDIVAMLREGKVSNGNIVARIRKRAFNFFALWYTKGKHPTLGGEYWHSALFSRVANDKAIYKIRTLKVNCKIVVKAENDDFYYRGATQCALLIPREINIKLQEYSKGIDSASIDDDFVID